jgi:hypothetical protein
MPSNLEYHGKPIRIEDEMLNLTDMWKADGSDASKKPSEWLSQESAKRFIEFLALTKGIPEAGDPRFGLVAVTKGGSSRGSTSAHWQVGLAYLKIVKGCHSLPLPAKRPTCDLCADHGGTDGQRQPKDRACPAPWRQRH